MATSAGKKGTKTPRKKRRNGNGKVGFLGHTVAFLTGALSSAGGGTAVAAVVDEFTEMKPHPAVDGAISLVTGGATTGASAAVKPLRKFVPGQIAGNIVGAGVRTAWKWWRKTKATEGTGNVRKVLRKRLANGAGNVRDTVEEAARLSLAEKFRTN